MTSKLVKGVDWGSTLPKGKFSKGDTVPGNRSSMSYFFRWMHRIVEQHRGKLTVSSDGLGKGST